MPSGSEQDKFERLGIPLCRPGWKPLIPADALEMPREEEKPGCTANSGGNTNHSNKANEDSGIAIASCVAHLRCKVHSLEDKAGHLLCLCKIEEAWVQKDYWDGNHFIQMRDDVPPYLTFLGSQRLGYVCRPAHFVDSVVGTSS